MHHGVGYARFMESANDRLRTIREKRGYDSAKAAAEAMGIAVPTYLQHESGLRGSGSVPRKAAERYASFFRVSPEWLLFGAGDATDPNPSEDEIAEILAEVQAQMPATLPHAEWPRYVAAALKLRLDMLSNDRSKAGKPGRPA